MHAYSGHESEWQRQLRQAERQLRREIHGADRAKELGTSLMETQSVALKGRGQPGPVVARVGRRVASVLAVLGRRPRLAGRP